MSRIGLAFAAALTVLASTPHVMAAGAATEKPLRTMTFSFHFAAIPERYMDSSGYDGTITVDVLATAPNEGLVLTIEQHVPLIHSFDVSKANVVVYPDGQVDYAQGTILSPAETALARFLARGFIDGNRIDEKNHWQVELKHGPVSVKTDFTIQQNINGILTVDESETFHDDGRVTYKSGKITYDMNRTVPTNIHEQTDGYKSVAAGRFIFDCRLVSDSFSTAKSDAVEKTPR